MAELVVRVSATRSVTVDAATGDVSAQGRLLLAGLGPISTASGHDGALLLEAESGRQWLIRLSPGSGLVSSVERIGEADGGEPGAAP